MRCGIILAHANQLYDMEGKVRIPRANGRHVDVHMVITVDQLGVVVHISLDTSLSLTLAISICVVKSTAAYTVGLMLESSSPPCDAVN